MAVSVSNSGVTPLWVSPDFSWSTYVLLVIGGPDAPGVRLATPEFFTALVGTNELQDGLEVPPEGLLVF